MVPFGPPAAEWKGLRWSGLCRKCAWVSVGHLFHKDQGPSPALQIHRFDMRVAATGLYGVGIYFAVNASYSDSGYVFQNTDKSKEMFICRVTCGKHVPGNSALRRPPPKVCQVPRVWLATVDHTPCQRMVVSHGEPWKLRRPRAPCPAALR